ncbi:hypothetical protein TNCV_1029121 [Trichonephila clavipes]|nr:hypothetical protein TNCV_1029121 [Trichonephila clavipes]
MQYGNVSLLQAGMISLFQMLEVILPHLSPLSEVCFTIALYSSLDSFYNAIGIHPLIFPLTPGKSAFVSKPISISDPSHQKVILLNSRGRVNYTLLVISHWQRHKNLHTALGLISLLFAWT